MVEKNVDGLIASFVTNPDLERVHSECLDLHAEKPYPYILYYFADRDNRRSFITRQNPAIWDA